jgi:UDP-N-acetylmuramyl pentapeptide phosphotransferase/UDP-N-acetylglucosamine-1-phosphate transferase
VAEDITKRVGVTQRLLATMASGVLAWWITDYSLSRVDVWGVDWLLRYTLVSVVFTAFAVGGVANSINIIDGFNGLASTMSSLAFIGFAMIAWQVGDHALMGASIVLAACVWGFFWVNWPLGKIFLGDGGSYFIGFALAWVSVLLIERNPGVSAFAPLVICAHPITEVLFSIYRRYYKESHPGHPDRLHFHSLVKQRYLKIGGFNPSYRISADYLSVLQLFSAQDFKSIYIPQVFIKMRLGGVSNNSIISIVNKSGEDWRALRACKFTFFGALYAILYKNFSKLAQFT